MKIKNLEIKKVLKNTAAVLVTGTILATTPIVNISEVEASTYTENYSVMNYFTDTVQYDVEKYLNKELSSTNLTKLLGYYDTLYDYVYRNKFVRNTYYRNLNEYEQNTLNYLLINWGNEIYELYKSKTYFKTNCKNTLGFTLKYDSQETGYDYEHEKIMDYFTDTLDENLDTYLSETNSQSYLKKALDVYKNLVDYVKGNKRIHGYVFSELTQTEQEDLIRLLENWTYDIIDEYQGYNYYSNSCISKIGWTVSIENFNRELEKYIGTYSTITNNPYAGNNIQTYYPPVNGSYQTTVNPPIISDYAVPTPPSIEAESTPKVENAPVVTNQPTINNTPVKNWHAMYNDPSYNTSRGDYYDYVPEYVDEYDNYRYNQDMYGYYNQGPYGYYDAYGNYIPYNQYNNYNQYQEGYVEDYAPKYIR